MGLSVGSLRGSSPLFHGTDEPHELDGLQGGSFLSDSRKTARHFALLRTGRGFILSYRTWRRPERIVQLNTDADARALLDWYAAVRGAPSPYLAEWETWPEGLLDGFIRMGPENMEVVDALCSEGIDGWQATNVYRGGGSDVMLCRPAKWLKLVEVTPVHDSGHTD